MKTLIRSGSKLSAFLYSIALIGMTYLHCDAQNVEIHGTLEISNLSIENAASEILIRKADGRIGTREVSSLPTAAIPNSGIIISETSSNMTLLNAGFKEIGKQSMQYATKMIGEWTTTSVVSTPSPRANHSAVWTGNEMIVWGGGNATNTFKDGGIYNPVNNSWTTFQNNAPVARTQHTAIWTGTEMIVWGGVDGSGEDPLGSGSRLLPGTLLWTIMSTAQAPSERFGHTAVWTGTEMIIWGGMGSTLYGDGAKYNPISNTWASVSTVNAPSPRAGHTAIWTGSEMIIWGGLVPGVGFLNDGHKYNPLTNTWTPINQLNAPSVRGYHNVVWTGSEMIIWGGIQNTGELNSGGIYNPTLDTWTDLPLLGAPSERSSHEAVWTGSSMIIYGAGASFEETKIYDPTGNKWLKTNTTNEPSQRISSTAIWTGNEMIIWGGLDSGGYTSTGGKLDPNGQGGYNAYETVEFYLYRKE